MSKYKIGIVGKGALGLLYATIIERNLGTDAAFFIMDDERYQRHVNDRIVINGKERSFKTVTADEATQVDLVIVATKSTGLEQSVPLIERMLKEDTVIISVLNGITSERKLAAHLGWERIVPCVAYAMDASRFGSKLEYTKEGYLRIGIWEGCKQESLDRVQEILDACGIDYQVDEDVRHAMWSKFMANTGVNQVCAAFGYTYEELFADQTSEAFRTYIGAMREVMAVGRPQGVTLTEEDMNGYIDVLLHLDPKSTPSMAQDRINKNPGEVDEFSGEVIRMADELGLQVPCNRWLNARIHTIESEY